jgi:hypothetical protein
MILLIRKWQIDSEQQKDPKFLAFAKALRQIDLKVPFKYYRRFSA